MSFLQRLYKYFLVILVVYFVLNLTYLSINESLLIIAVITCSLLPLTRKLKDSLSAYIVSVVFLIISVFQPIDSIRRTEAYANSIRTSASKLLNESLRLKYLNCCLLFYIFVIFGVYLVQSLNNNSFRKKAIIEQPSIGKWISTKINFVFVAIIWSALRLIIQMRFQLLFPGRNATIAHSGIVVYLIRIVSLYIWALALNNIVSCSNGDKKFLYKSFLLAIICGAPQAIIGSRSEILLYIINIVLVWFIYYDHKRLGNKSMVGIVLFTTITAVLSIYVSNYFRTGSSSDVSSFLTDRLVGVVDGINVIDYIDNNGHMLPVSNYFNGLFSRDGTIYISSFYTHSICGYPMSIVHSWSIPCFGAGLLYGGYIGLVIFSFLQGLMIAIIEQGLKKNMQTNNDVFKSICLLYLFVQIILTSLIEGSIDKAGNFIIITVAVIAFDSVFKIRSKNYKVITS